MKDHGNEKSLQMNQIQVITDYYTFGSYSRLLVTTVVFMLKHELSNNYGNCIIVKEYPLL